MPAQVVLQPRAARRKPAPSFQRRALPVLLLAALSLYGMWFLNATYQATSDHASHAATDSRSQALDDGVQLGDAQGDDGFGEQQAMRAEEQFQQQQQQRSQPSEQQQQQQQKAGHAASGAVTAVGAVGAACDVLAPPQEYALHFSGRQEAVVSTSDDVRLDTGALTLSAWVRLSGPSDSREPTSIQTIASSKASGCTADAAHYGVSLFANAWNTDSGQVFLSWGNAHSGCEELASANGVVMPGKWAFVAATISDAGEAAIYVNGALVAHSAREGVGSRRVWCDQAAPCNGPVARIERGPAVHPMHVGMHADGTHALQGHLSAVSLHAHALDASQLRDLMCARHAAVTPRPLALLSIGARKKPASSALSRLTAGSETVQRLSVELDSISAPPGAASLANAGDEPVIVRARTLEVIGGGGGGGGGRGARSAAYPVKGHGGEGSGKPLANGWPLSWLPAMPKRPIDAAEVNASDALAYQRREHVRNVMRRAWSAYRKYAWGADELKPVSNRSHQWLNQGATLVDCLDNLWIMGMRAEFAEAREWVATKLHFNAVRSVSMFETVIRILGGLLSAFELSRDQIFLQKAQEVKRDATTRRRAMPCHQRKPRRRAAPCSADALI